MGDVAAHIEQEDMGLVFMKPYKDEWLTWTDESFALGPEDNPLGVRKVDRLAAAFLAAAGITLARVQGSSPMLYGGDTSLDDFHHFVSFLTDPHEVELWEAKLSDMSNEPALPAQADINGMTVILKGGQTLWTAEIERGFDHRVGDRKSKKRAAAATNYSAVTTLRNNDAVEAFMRDTKDDEVVATRMAITDIYIHLYFKDGTDWKNGPIIVEKRVDVLLSL